MESQIISIDQTRPLFIMETGIYSGRFQVITSVETRIALGGEPLSYFSYDEENDLELGVNIREIPNRDLSLLVRSAIGQPPMQAIVAELKKYAFNGDHDFVSLQEIYGNNLGTSLPPEGGINIYEINPRYFSRIADN